MTKISKNMTRKTGKHEREIEKYHKKNRKVLQEKSRKHNMENRKTAYFLGLAGSHQLGGGRPLQRLAIHRN